MKQPTITNYKEIKQTYNQNTYAIEEREVLQSIFKYVHPMCIIVYIGQLFLMT